MGAGWKTRLRDADLPHVDGAPSPAAGLGRAAPGAAASELVVLHGDVDATHATL
jgi:hypothetical protein